MGVATPSSGSCGTGMEEGDKDTIVCLPTMARPTTMTMPPTNKMPMNAIAIIKIRIPPREPRDGPLDGPDRLLLDFLFIAVKVGSE